MKNNIEIIEDIKSNLNQIICINDFESIAIGGSTARGYNIKGSDIDLICISSKIDKYKKKFINFLDYFIEIHLIPTTYINNLITNISEYINIEGYSRKNNSIQNQFGAKKCKMISKKDDELTKFLSDWRELKKIVDTVILIESDKKYIEKLKSVFKFPKFNENINRIVQANITNYNSLDFLINSLKIHAILNNDVFSKVLWLDKYLTFDYNKEIKDIILEKIKIDDSIKEKFYVWYKKNISYLIKQHEKIKCDICKDDYLQCNIMRCINDYYNDSIKAKTNKLIYGEILSIRKTIDYIYMFFEKIKYFDRELDLIYNSYQVDDNLNKMIFDILNKELRKIC